MPFDCGVRLLSRVPPPSDSPHVVRVLQRHPHTSPNPCRQRERMLPAQLQRLEDKDLADKMRRRQHMREQAELVQHGVVDAVCAVDANHAGQKGIHPKQARREWCYLVGGRRSWLVLFGGRRCRNDLRDGVGRGGVGIGDKEPVVDAAGVVQGEKVLSRVAYGSNGDLAGRESAC